LPSFCLDSKLKALGFKLFTEHQRSLGVEQRRKIEIGVNF